MSPRRQTLIGRSHLMMLSPNIFTQREIWLYRFRGTVDFQYVGVGVCAHAARARPTPLRACMRARVCV